MMQEAQSRELNEPIPTAIALARRAEYGDIAKGIGIILVVMGHNDFALISPFAHKLIYSFHMPMFFFMSGMFFKPDVPFWAFVQNRFNRVLKPFIAIILLIYFANLSFSKVSLIMASRRLLKAMYANGHYLDWVQLWFLPHLFAVSFFAYFFFQVVKRTRGNQIWWAILVLMYIVNVFLIKLFWPLEFNLLGEKSTLYGLPFSLDIVVVSGFFFIVGYELYKKQNVVLLDNPLALFLSGAVLILLVWYLPARINFNERQFDSLIINTIEALLGIFFILALSKRLEQAGWLSALFRYIGGASLTILIFQVPIQEYWGQKLFALTNSLQGSYWVSFLIGVVGPIFINGLFIRPNPIVRRWFGQSAPKENRQPVVSAFE